MLRGLYTAYTGMRTQQEKMDAVANNLANVDTTGYKKDQMVQQSFKEIYTYKINDPEIPHSQKIGKMSLGVKVNQVYTDHMQGSLKQTDELLNIAIQGKGLMKVGKLQEDGTLITKYTRDGSLNLDQDGRLVTNDGLFVMGEEEIIQLNSGNIRINADGTIYDSEVRMDQIQFIGFEDYGTLRKEGSSLYTSTEESIEKPFEGTIEQGFLEASNVNSIEEMINMITTMRTYESNQKVIQTYDATMDKVVNSVGVVR